MKVRADQLAVEQGLCASRTLAQRMIMAGEIRLGPDTMVKKPGQMLPDDTELILIAPPKYVSRGAFKLLGAIEACNPDLEGKIALDLGASTGGFTDLLLQNGAAKVYAVDVGYGQLHDKLRRDDRVVVMERTNARDLSKELIPDAIDILVGDVSFISLTKVLPPCKQLLAPNAWIMVLVKPQFECEKGEVGDKGVVRDENIRQRCVNKILNFATTELQWQNVTVVPSPIKGPKGNQEYIAVFRNIG